MLLSGGVYLVVIAREVGGVVQVIEIGVFQYLVRTLYFAELNQGFFMSAHLVQHIGNIHQSLVDEFFILQFFCQAEPLLRHDHGSVNTERAVFGKQIAQDVKL